MSKTSQKTAKKAKVDKQVAPKASTNGATPKAPKTPKVYDGNGVTVPAGFTGNADRMTKGLSFGVHSVVDGKTMCGSDATSITPNLAANFGGWRATKDAVNCGRCLKAIAKQERIDEKAATREAKAASKAKAPTPISKAKGKKAAAAK